MTTGKPSKAAKAGAPKAEKNASGLPDPLPSIVVLAGDDEFGKDEALRKILELEGKDGDVLSHQLDLSKGGEAEIARIRRDLATRSLFGGRRMIVVRDADPLIKRAAKSLPDLLDAPPGNLLILRFSAVDQRLTFFKKVKDSGGLILCERPKADHLDLDPSRGIGGSELLRTITEDFARASLQIEAPAALEIALRIGNDRLAVASEIAKLSLLLGSAKRVTREVIAQVTPQSAALEPFRLFQEVASGELRKALERVYGMLDRGVVDRGGKRVTDPVSIALMQIALLHQRLALLARLREAEARKLSREEIAAAIGVKNPGQIYFLSKEVSLPLVAHAEAALVALHDADRRIKIGQPAATILPQLIARLARLAKARARAGGAA